MSIFRNSVKFPSKNIVHSAKAQAQEWGARKGMWWGMAAVGGVGLLSFLTVLWLSSPEEGWIATTVFNLSIFLFLMGAIFFISVLVRKIINVLGHRDGEYALWVYFFRSAFLALSAIGFLAFNRAGLFAWEEILFWAMLWGTVEYWHWRVARLA